MSEFKQLIYTAAEIDERLGRVDKFSNPNLLINPFFQINQRGQSSYSGAGYGLDGWRVLQATGSLSPEVYGMSFTDLSSDITKNALLQEIENPQRLIGQAITLSANIKNAGGGVRLRVRFASTTSGYAGPLLSDAYSGITSSSGITSVTTTVPEGTAGMAVMYRFADTAQIRCAKLELGEISTLANDAPPKIATDLAECQRYFRLWKTEAARTAALNEVGLMRLESPTLGTIVIGGTTYYTASAEL